MGDHLWRVRFLRWWEYSGIWLSDDSATFALFDVTGKMVGYQTYCPFVEKTRGNEEHHGKYYTYSPEFAVWGAQTLETGAPLGITEGIFDAAPLNLLGFSTLAILSHTPPKWFRRYLHVLKQRHPFLLQVKDGDDSAKTLTAADYVVTMPEGKDMGDMGCEGGGDYLKEKGVPKPKKALQLFSKE